MSLNLDANGRSAGDATDAKSRRGPGAPATGEHARRSLSPRGRKTLLTAAGAVGVLISVVGFVLTSEALEDRAAVLVAARDIAVGETLSADDFIDDLAEMSSIPYVAWTPEAPFSFEGMIAAQNIPAGAAVLFDMVIAPATEPVGNELELSVPLDVSLETSELGVGDTVLLIDPGVEPTQDANGRPRSVIRTMELRDFEASSIRLLLRPDEWGEWRALLRSLGATPMVRKVPLGGDADEFRDGLERVWEAEWRNAIDVAAASRPPPEPGPGPGELEARIPLDSSLATVELRNGDRVLLIDPGAEPNESDDGRARSVLMEMTLENYSNGTMRLFVSPEDWVQWRALPGQLGAAPMVLPIPDGTDVADLRTRLDDVWRVVWNGQIGQRNSQGIPEFDGTFGLEENSQIDAETTPDATAGTASGAER